MMYLNVYPLNWSSERVSPNRMLSGLPPRIIMSAFAIANVSGLNS